MLHVHSLIIGSDVERPTYTRAGVVDRGPFERNWGIFHSFMGSSSHIGLFPLWYSVLFSRTTSYQTPEY